MTLGELQVINGKLRFFSGSTHDNFEFTIPKTLCAKNLCCNTDPLAKLLFDTFCEDKVLSHVVRLWPTREHNLSVVFGKLAQAVREYYKEKVK